MGNPCVSKMAAFLLDNQGVGLPKLCVKLSASGGGMRTMPGIGHPYPRLGFEIGPPQTMPDCP